MGLDKKLVNTKVLIFGNGQIGNFYKNFFNSQGIKSKITDCDITNKKAIEKIVKDYNPDVIINTAAKTNLEWCSANKLETFNVNVLGANNVAEVCAENGIYLIHFSSGCIFESKNVRDKKTETSVPNPAAYYSWTKVWAEQLIQFNKPKDFKYLILRPRQPISAQFNYKNTLVKMLTFTRFINTPNSITVIEDLMEWTLKFLNKKPVGILNASNTGYTTPYAMGKLLKKHILPSMVIQLIPKKELDKLTPNRRVDTILDTKKLESIVGNVESIKKRAEKLVIELADNIKELPKSEIKNQLDKTLAQSKARTIVNNVSTQLIETGK